MQLSIEEKTIKTMNGRCNNRDFYHEHIDQHLDQLFASALRLTRNQADAEDLVAEAVTRAWARIDDLQNTERFVPWLLSIMTNTFISEMRRARNKAAHISYVEETSDDAPAFSLFERLHQPFLLWWSNPEQEFLNKILKEDIEAAIDNLPDVFRIVIIMAEIEGMSYQDIADAIESPIGTVRSRLARGRSLLQKSLWLHAQDKGLVASDS